MSNVLNLLSESTYIEKMDIQNALLLAIAKGVGGGDTPVTVDSWTVVQQLVRLGIASKVFSIGDQLICDHATYGKLTWDIVGIDHDTPANTEYTHALSLHLHDCLNTTFQFDAAEPTNPDENRSKYGSNNSLQSGIRQWLNSDGDPGKWWEPQTEYDVQPTYASSTAGFLKGLDTDFLAVVGEVSKVTALNTVTDGGGSITTTEKFFLPSITEVYGGLNGSIAEGAAYAYYANNSDLSAAGTGADTNRIKYRNGTAQYWWLRSPYPSHSFIVRSVYTAGYVDNISAYYSHGVVPACCII